MSIQQIITKANLSAAQFAFGTGVAGAITLKPLATRPKIVGGLPVAAPTDNESSWYVDSSTTPNTLHYHNGSIWTPVGSGAAATVVEMETGTDPNKFITPATLPFISANRTITVPTDYPTVYAALIYLQKYRIIGSAIVTISVLAGDHLVSTPLVGHPDGSKIVVKGAALTGAFPVTSDWNMTGTSLAAHVTDRPNNRTMLRAKFPTRLIMSAPVNGFDLEGNHSISIENILLDGMGTGGGVIGLNLDWGQTVYAKNSVVFNFTSYGARIRGSLVTTTFASGNCFSDGIRVDPNGVYHANVPATDGFYDNNGYGVYADRYSAIGATGFVCQSNTLTPDYYNVEDTFIPAAPATLAEVLAGTVANKYVAPLTMPVIRANKTINVPTDYPTLAAAMTYLNGFSIQGDGVTVTVNMEAGDHNIAANVILHPQGNRINIQGQPLSSAAPIDSDFSITGNTAGARNTDKGNHRTMLRGKFPTRLNIASGVTAFDPSEGTVVNLVNLLLDGNAAGVAAIAGTNAAFVSLTNVAVLDFTGVGVSASNSNIYSNGLWLSGCSSDNLRLALGANFVNFGTTVLGSYSSGGIGMSLDQNAALSSSSTGLIYSRGHSTIGIRPINGAVVSTANHVVLSNNGLYGAQVIRTGRLNVSGDLTITNNGNIGLVVSATAYVACLNLTSTGSAAGEAINLSGGSILVVYGNLVSSSPSYALYANQNVSIYVSGTANCTSTASSAIGALYGSNITIALAVTIPSATLSGLYAFGNSNVTLQSSYTATSCNAGVNADANSNVYVGGAINFNTMTTYGLYATDNSTITQRDAQTTTVNGVSGATSYGVNADGGSIKLGILNTSGITGAASYAIFATNGGEVVTSGAVTIATGTYRGIQAANNSSVIISGACSVVGATNINVYSVYNSDIVFGTALTATGATYNVLASNNASIHCTSTVDATNGTSYGVYAQYNASLLFANTLDCSGAGVANLSLTGNSEVWVNNGCVADNGAIGIAVGAGSTYSQRAGTISASGGTGLGVSVAGGSTFNNGSGAITCSNRTTASGGGISVSQGSLFVTAGAVTASTNASGGFALTERSIARILGAVTTSSNTGIGVSVSLSDLRILGAVTTSSNTGTGFNVQFQCRVYSASTITSSNNGNAGIAMDRDSFFSTGAVTCDANAGPNILVSSNSYMQCASTVAATNGTGYGIQLRNESKLEVALALTLTGNGLQSIIAQYNCEIILLVALSITGQTGGTAIHLDYGCKLRALSNLTLTGNSGSGLRLNVNCSAYVQGNLDTSSSAGSGTYLAYGSSLHVGGTFTSSSCTGAAGHGLLAAYNCNVVTSGAFTLSNNGGVGIYLIGRSLLTNDSSAACAANANTGYNILVQLGSQLIKTFNTATLSCTGSGYPIYLDQGSIMVWGGNVTATGSATGVRVRTGSLLSLAIASSLTTSNTTAGAGITADISAKILVGGDITSSNNTAGIGVVASTDSTIQAVNITASTNLGSGITAQYGSKVIASGNVIANSNTYVAGSGAISAENNSLISIDGTTNTTANLCSGIAIAYGSSFHALGAVTAGPNAAGGGATYGIRVVIASTFMVRAGTLNASSNQTGNIAVEYSSSLYAALAVTANSCVNGIGVAINYNSSIVCANNLTTNTNATQGIRATRASNLSVAGTTSTINNTPTATQGNVTAYSGSMLDFVGVLTATGGNGSGTWAQDNGSILCPAAVCTGCAVRSHTAVDNGYTMVTGNAAAGVTYLPAINTNANFNAFIKR
jgi:hypothetical protein